MSTNHIKSSLFHKIEYGNYQGSLSFISASCVDTSRSSNENIRRNDVNMVVPSEIASKIFNVILKQNVRMKRQPLTVIQLKKILSPKSMPKCTK